MSSTATSMGTVTSDPDRPVKSVGADDSARSRWYARWISYLRVSRGRQTGVDSSGISGRALILAHDSTHKEIPELGHVRDPPPVLDEQLGGGCRIDMSAPAMKS